MKNFPSDKWLFWIYYPIVSISINLIGQGNSFTQLIRIPSFYSDLLLAFGLSFSIGVYLSFIWKTYLPKDVPSSKYIRKRLFLGLILPFAVCVLVEMAYLVWLLEIPLDKSHFFVLDLPLIFIFLLIANLFFLGRYLFENQKELIEAKSEEIKSIKNSKIADFVTVAQSNRKINVPLNEILYVVFENEIVFLVLESGAKIPSPSTLKLISEKLPPSSFFKVNRKLIVTRKAIQSFQPTGLRKLSLRIKNRPHEEFMVPKAKVREFKDWFEN